MTYADSLIENFVDPVAVTPVVNYRDRICLSLVLAGLVTFSFRYIPYICIDGFSNHAQPRS